ncbi:MAG: hypothetical protein KBT87_04920 [Gammaproteobacteria bacterium]|jgi:hypothetical protein|nr:hypothetical protein [Gammaproteobacteria bacterium]MBQ0773996.1 hypothetical protein [Gammaproteobacteria bacterium]|tara:strand:+ start:34739 stop:35467 length:729 start_codon:yes stop_codon:yes gene_type:complete
MTHPIITARRQFLRQAMGSAIAVTAGGASLLPALVQALGKIPDQLIPGKSIYDMRGTVFVDGRLADEDTYISANSLVETGSSSYVVFVIGFDAHLMRENGRVQFSGTDSFEEGLKLATGKLLSVFGARTGGQTHVAQTTTATIGIRGTGVYLESEEDVSYACTCYGKVDIASIDDPSSKETIISVHHDAPRYITKDGKTGSRITSAPMKNHTDAELMLIEQIVGRTPDFTTLKSYTAPRKGY